MLLLVGCATLNKTHFVVEVDSLARDEAGNAESYILLPGNEGVEINDLQFQEYARYLIRALASRGYELAEHAEDAELAIIMSYGIGDPKTHQYTYSLPVWGQTGVSSSHTSGTATAFGNSATYSGTTTNTPKYGITGYTAGVGSVTSYFRYAHIVAYDFSEYRKTEEEIQLWRTSLTSSGSSGDLRRVFPILISAAVPHLGTNTGQQVEVKLFETDDVVSAIKGVPDKNEEAP